MASTTAGPSRPQQSFSDNHAASSSSSSRSSPVRPRNLLCIFQAHFHVKRGNEITYQHGHEIDLQQVEWQVLPSGSHAVQSDLIWFTPPGTEDFIAEVEDGRGEREVHFRKIGVAAYRNRRLTAQEERQEELDQRGARMIAVGFVAMCHSDTPSAQLAACLPHTDALDKLADLSASDPTNHSLLSAFYDQYRFDPGKGAEVALALQAAELHRNPSSLLRKPKQSPSDPMLDLPAISSALGLVLPDLLRRLLVPGTRLLIFSPTGAETRSAASIAWVLAEILQIALGNEDVDGQDDDLEQSEATLNGQSSGQRRSVPGPSVRGIVGLQDITTLQDEEDMRQSSGRAASYDSWISWTADKIYLDKPALYDYLLDLSPLHAATRAAGSGSTSLLAICESSSSAGTTPIFSKVERPTTQAVETAKTRGRFPPQTKLKAQRWLPRDFAIYRTNEQRSVKLAKRPRHMAHRASRSSFRHSTADDGSVRTPDNRKLVSAASARRKTGGPAVLLSTLIGFVRYWLSSLWFVPHQWRLNLRESYGYVPLSIRPDGGVQSGLMLLPESDDETDAEESVAGTDDEGSEGEREEAKGVATATSADQTAAAASQNSQTLQVPDRNSRYIAGDVEGDKGNASEVGASRSRRRSGSGFSIMTASSAGSSGGSRSDIDPIFAACGAAGSPSARRRRESIRSTLGISPNKVAEDDLVATDYVDHDDESNGGGQPRRDSSTSGRSRTSGHTSRRHSRHASNDAGSEDLCVGSSALQGKDALLSTAIFSIWSEWARDLVVGLDEIKTLLFNPEAAAMAEEEEADESQSLLSRNSRASTVSVKGPTTIRTEAVSALGLNAALFQDRELVCSWMDSCRPEAAATAAAGTSGDQSQSGAVNIEGYPTLLKEREGRESSAAWWGGLLALSWFRGLR